MSNKMIELSSAGGSLILPISSNKVKSTVSKKSSKSTLEGNDNQPNGEPSLEIIEYGNKDLLKSRRSHVASIQESLDHLRKIATPNIT